MSTTRILNSEVPTTLLRLYVGCIRDAQAAIGGNVYAADLCRMDAHGMIQEYCVDDPEEFKAALEKWVEGQITRPEAGPER